MGDYKRGAVGKMSVLLTPHVLMSERTPGPPVSVSVLSLRPTGPRL